MASLNEIQINEFTVPILTQIGEGRRGRIKRVQKVQRVHRVQRGWWAPLWTRPAGVRVQKVQKVQKVQRGKVGGCAASFYKTFTTALSGEGKGFPLARFAGLPPQAVAEQPVFYLELHMRLRLRGALLCPPHSGGKVVP